MLLCACPAAQPTRTVIQREDGSALFYVNNGVSGFVDQRARADEGLMRLQRAFLEPHSCGL